MSSTDRVVLAYSGGLDTSVAIGWIGEQTGREVVAVAGDGAGDFLSAHGVDRGGKEIGRPNLGA